MINFRDQDENCPGFAIVRETAGVVNLMLNLIGQGDFEVYVTPEVARKIARALDAAADVAT